MAKNKKKSRSKPDAVTVKSVEVDTGSSDQPGVSLSRWLRNTKVLALIFLLLTFLTYFVSLNNEFVWDDQEVIQKSYFRIERSSLFSGFIPTEESVKRLQYYRPILAMSYVIDWNIWGLDPLGFHMTNGILYSLTVMFFYLMSLEFAKLYKIRRWMFFSITSTLLFLFHPMHVESVSWVSGRTDVLCCMFFIIAIIFHLISYQRKYTFIPAGIFLALSLFSKEVAVTFPFLVAGMDFLNGRLKNRWNIPKYLLYFIVLLVYLTLRSRAFVTIPHVYNPAIENSTQSFSYAGYILGVFKVLIITYSYYIKQLVFPYTFNAFVSSLPSGWVYFAASFITIATIALIALYCYYRKNMLTVTGIYWVYLTIGPSALIAVFAFIATPVAERYLFLPSVGYSLLLGYILLNIVQNSKYQKAGYVMVLILLSTYAGFCIDRQSVWNDRVSFWRDATIKSVNHSIPHINYGMALLDNGEMEEAVKEFKISLNPRIENTPTGRAIAANNLGVAYINMKQYENAAKALVVAINSDPEFYKTYYHLGLLYYIKANTTNDTKDYLTSEKYLLQAVSLLHNYGKALLLLAKVNDEMGEIDKSHYYAKRALQSGLVNELAAQAEVILKKQ